MSARTWLVIVPEGDTVQYMEAPGLDRPVAADLDLFKRSTVNEYANAMSLGAPQFGVPVHVAERAEMPL